MPATTHLKLILNSETNYSGMCNANGSGVSRAECSRVYGGAVSVI